jgi:peptidoglycan-N-acetylglucosamine deacetylase
MVLSLMVLTVGAQGQAELPHLVLAAPPPQLNRLVYDSNGFIEVAYAVMLLSLSEDTLPQHLALAQQVATQAFAARDSLNQIDLAVYRAGDYQGEDPAAPLPRLTASVTRLRLEEFVRLDSSTLQGYERLWINTDLEFPVIPLLPGERGHAVYQGSESSTQVALTFDDLPHPIYNTLLLDTLARAEVKATFFLIGRNALAYPYFVTDALAAGHELANHTYSHQRLIKLTEAEAKAEVLQADAIFTAITGQYLKAFRFPGGRVNEDVMRWVRDLGFDVIFWTDDPGDYQRFPAEVLEQRLESRLTSGGDIILLHDNVPETIATLPIFIDYVHSQGLEFVKLSDLIR